MEEHSSKISQVFNGSIAIELTGKIMVIIIIILFLIIAFVLILQLYTRWFRSSIDESTPSSHSHRREESAVVRKGLEAVVLRSLPVVIYSPENFKDGLECAVCLSELTQGEKARFLPKCEHGFHVDCIDMWFQSNSTCPLCRNPISPISSNSLDSHLGEELDSNDENSDSGSSLESPVFPTNVLFWGDETRVSSRGVCLEEGLTTSSSSSTTNARLDGIVAIDIPNEPSTSAGGVGVGCLADEETKTVVTTRLRTLKRLLSRERRGSNSNSPPIVVDIEQVGRGQS